MKNYLFLSVPESFYMFFTEMHGRGLGLVAHAPSGGRDVRLPLKKLLQNTIPCNFFAGILNKKLP